MDKASQRAQMPKGSSSVLNQRSLENDYSTLNENAINWLASMIKIIEQITSLGTHLFSMVNHSTRKKELEKIQNNISTCASVADLGILILESMRTNYFY